MSTQFDWQKAYEAAVLEEDNSKLIEKANLAEDAIFARLRTFPFGDDRERLAIQKALMALQTLRRERLDKSNRRPYPEL